MSWLFFWLFSDSLHRQFFLAVYDTSQFTVLDRGTSQLTNTLVKPLPNMFSAGSVYLHSCWQAFAENKWKFSGLFGKREMSSNWLPWDLSPPIASAAPFSSCYSVLTPVPLTPLLCPPTNLFLLHPSVHPSQTFSMPISTVTSTLSPTLHRGSQGT